MATEFDTILDECIDRIILQNETVDECLARYPDYAADLEPHLQTVMTTLLAARAPISIQAKTRGRERLLAERAAFNRARANRRSSWMARLPLLAAPARWAAAAGVFALFALAGGAGTVAAASGTLPGDALYPVKRATEQVRLALESSEAKKAELQVVYAEQRAIEIGHLVRKGETKHLPDVTDDLKANLTAAARIAHNLQSQKDVEGVQSALQSSAPRALSIIQNAYADAPEDKKKDVSSVMQSSGASYGTAVDSVQAKAPPANPTVVAAATGKVQVRVNDLPSPKVQSLVLTVGRIEVHRSGQAEDSWMTVSDSPLTFDLVQLQGAHQFLSEQDLTPGTYTKFRLSITDARATIEGVEQPVTVPSDSLTLQRPFVVAAGATTVVLLDIDGEDSLISTGNGRYMLKPSVNILTRDPGSDISLAPKDSKGPSDNGRGGPENRGNDKSPFSKQVVITGEVQVRDPASIIVQDKRVVLTEQTAIEGRLMVGGKAEVQAIESDGGVLTAVHITVEGGGITPTPDKSARNTIVEGRVRKINGNQFVVDDRTVIVSGNTVVQGTLAVGAEVKVTGVAKGKNLVNASLVTVQGTGVPPTPTVTEQSLTVEGAIGAMANNRWTVQGYTVLLGPDTEVHGTPTVGARVIIIGVQGEGEDKGKGEGRGEGKRVLIARTVSVVPGLTLGPTQTATAVPSATQPPPPSPSAAPGTVRLEGVLLGMLSGTLWTIDGHTVVLNERTIIVGQSPLVGARVRVEGTQRQDGVIVASRITVLFIAGSPSPSVIGTPASSPTPPTAIVSVQGTPTATPLVTPGPSATPSPTATPVPETPAPDEVSFGVFFDGTVDSQIHDEWRISGRVVRVTEHTLIRGVPVVGALVQVQGTGDVHGRIEATHITAAAPSLIN